MAFLVQGSPIITNDRDLSAVGVATLTEDINIGRLLYDANGNVGAANSILITKDNTLQWVDPQEIGISTGGEISVDRLEILATTGIGLTVDSDASIEGNLIMGGEIHGPSNLVIDPEVIGDNTGSVTIKGDLIVLGTETIVDSTTVSIADKKIGLATNITTDVLLDGSGFTVGQPGSSVEKSFLYNNTSSVLESSTGLGVTVGGSYKVGTDVVLTQTTLGSNVINSSLTSVGDLTSLTVSGAITANGNIVGDNSTNISGINSVTADNFYGDGSGLTNISADSIDLTGTYQNVAGLNVTGPGIALTVANDVSIGGTMSIDTIFAQNYDSLSDRELKENISPLQDTLAKLAGIDGVSYNWKNNGKSTIGVIAQDVQAVYPELTTQGEHLTVNYNGLVGVLIRAVKELNGKVEELQRQLDEK